MSRPKKEKVDPRHLENTHSLSDVILKFDVKEHDPKHPYSAPVPKYERVGSRTFKEACQEVRKKYGEDFRGFDNSTLSLMACCGVNGV